MVRLVLVFLLALTATAQPLLPPKGPEDPIFSPEDEKILAAYLLDLGKLGRFEAATKALAAKAEDEELQKELSDDEAKQDGIERWVEVIRSTKPATMAVLKAAGLEPREFVLSSYALTLAMVYADLMKANPLSPLPVYVPRANLGFVRAQEDRLAALLASLEKENPAPGTPVASPTPSAKPEASPAPPSATPQASPKPSAAPEAGATPGAVAEPSAAPR